MKLEGMEEVRPLPLRKNFWEMRYYVRVGTEYWDDTKKKIDPLSKKVFYPSEIKKLFFKFQNQHSCDIEYSVPTRT